MKAVRQQRIARHVLPRLPQGRQENAVLPVTAVRHVRLLRETVPREKDVRISKAVRTVRREENVRDSAHSAKAVLPVKEEGRVRKEADGISVPADRDSVPTGEGIPAEKTENLLRLRL